MVRVITQETFDAVVKENIDEFGLEKEEAIKEAIAQFESQGVNLCNIVTSSTEDEHVILEAIKQLTDIDLNKEESIIEMCLIVKSECDKGLAEKVLATQNNGYETLMKIAEKSKSINVLKEVIAALASLLDSNPDPFDANGFQMIVDVLTNQNNTDVIGSSLDMTLAVCVRHEQNRQNLVHNKVLGLLDKHFEKHPVQVARIWQALVQDDDVRVPYGKAHDHAREIVEEHNAIPQLLCILKEGKSTTPVAEMALYLSCLSSLSVRNEYCQLVSEKNGLTILFELLVDPDQKPQIIKESLILLKTVAGNDNVKNDIRASKGIGIIVDAILKNLSNKGICYGGCTLIAAICLRTPENAQTIMEAGGAQLLIQVLKTHLSNGKIVGAATNAIRNIVSRSKHLAEPFIELEGLLNEAIKMHPKSSDSIKSALRDLGLKVHLKEEWTGTGGLEEKLTISND